MHRRAAGDDPGEPPLYPDPDFLQLDSWLVVNEDGTATFYVGKTDGGQGTGTATRPDHVRRARHRLGHVHPGHGPHRQDRRSGGSGGSDAIERDAMVARRVAAEGRRVLLEMASERFDVPWANST